MYTPKISIIIPIYGVEKYIERCARSLFSQTLGDIEYIFVNDCTKDNSIQILTNIIDEYPQRRNQIRIIHHDINKGLPEARHSGILVAKGRYIAHCDSDDWTEPDMYKKLFETAERMKSDIVICDYFVSDGVSKKSKPGCFSENRDDVIINLLFERGTWAVWNKLVRRELYDASFIFPQNNMGEDMAYSIQTLFKSQKISYIKEPLYNYFYNPLSITNQKSASGQIKKFQQACLNLEIVENTLKDSPEFFEALLNLKAVERNLLLHVFREPGIAQMWRDQYKGLTWQLLKSKSVGNKQKLRALYYEFLSYVYQYNKAK